LVENLLRLAKTDTMPPLHQPVFRRIEVEAHALEYNSYTAVHTLTTGHGDSRMIA
jgi:hypothetical protein